MSSIADLKATIAALTDAASRGKKEERLAAARAAAPELSLEDTATAEEVDAAILYQSKYMYYVSLSLSLCLCVHKYYMYT